jgi:hypothetical protein
MKYHCLHPHFPAVGVVKLIPLWLGAGWALEKQRQLAHLRVATQQQRQRMVAPLAVAAAVPAVRTGSRRACRERN